MPVREDEAVVRLEGACPVDDAETLAGLLLERADAAVDWSACTHMHAAVYQVLLRMRPVMHGACGDPLVARWLAGPGVARDG